MGTKFEFGPRSQFISRNDSAAFVNVSLRPQLRDWPHFRHFLGDPLRPGSGQRRFDPGATRQRACPRGQRGSRGGDPGVVLDRAPVTIAPGEHRLLVKVFNGPWASGFRLRFEREDRLDRC